MKFLSKLFDLNSAQVTKTNKPLEEIKKWREQMPTWTISQMQERIREMKQELNKLIEKIPADQKLSIRKIDRTKSLPENEKAIQAKLYEFMPEVYAFVDEIFFRKVGFRYHDVQLRAAIILAQGQRLVELYTGEGKTMTFQLPTILYSLVGRGAHLVTVNDYLSRRDGEYAGHIAVELGLRVGIINSQVSYKFIPDAEIEKYKGEDGVKKRADMQNIDVSKMDTANLIEVSKREAYNCDITYGTNNEFGFDYLRDNMSWDLDNLSQRELYFCIIDESDSILIDEARTPLIISGIPTDADTEKYTRFARAVAGLEENIDYTVEHKTRSVSLTEDGIKRIESILEVENIWEDYSMAYHIENALKAKALFHKDDQYIIRNGEILIVDEFTGRVLAGRRYSEGLHQAIEAKEGVDIQQENRTFATITFQNYFRLYKILCGGSGTVMTEAEEFYKIYGLESVPIPTNKPVARIDYPDRIYKNQEAKFRAVATEVKEKHEKGQPVLIGTTSVDKSEIISRLLDEEGIKHEVLNAKFHEQEAKIIETAGRKGAVTVATNMAGRGADIVIGGGRRGDKAWEEIAELGGLHVIGTERHEARRIDNQLRGRTGRQGEPGSSRFYVALDDTLMRILGGEIISRLMSFVKLSDDMPIELKMISKQIEGAQKKIENLNFDSRKRVVDYDDVMNQHREIFYARRRNFVDRFEAADGKFLTSTQTINLNLPQFAKYKPEYEEKVAKAKEEVRYAAENIFFDVLNTELDNFEFNTDEESQKKFVEKLVTFVSVQQAVKVMKTSETDLGRKMLEKVKEFKTGEERLNWAFDIAKEAFENKLKEFGDDFFNLGKVITLQSIDNLWVDHLEIMKDVKEGIGLQAYAQKDPLVEYKNKAFNMFQTFIYKVNKEIALKILNVSKVQQPVATQVVTNVSDVKDISEGDREFVDDGINITAKPRKFDQVLRNAINQKAQQQASMRTNSSESSQTGKSGTKAKQISRNDKVDVKYKDGRVVKDVKFKKVEDDILAGEAEIIS